MVYILLGAPGSGKGTRAAILKEKLQIPHISTGDLLREKAKCADALGEKIASLMNAGNMVDQEIIDAVLLEKLQSVDLDKGIILDGYPRSLEQAKSLDKMFKTIGNVEHKAVLLDVSIDIIYDRLLNRIVCPKCKKIFDSKSAADVNGICDVCNAILEKRLDDNEVTIKNRIDVYFKNIDPIVNFYEEKGCLAKVDASSCPERILTVI
jgi:adenylate kinase